MNLEKIFLKKSRFKKKSGIWDYVGDANKSLELAGYENLHKKPSHRIDDGSYEILAAFARGNKTLDIACGDGFIEELSPETVGLDFSLSALAKARKKGAKNLVHGDAHSLPFLDNSFDIAICAGSFEHFKDPLRALKEMARVSKIQILTVHRKFPILFANYLRSLILSLRSIPDQPIDHPMDQKELFKLFKKAGLSIVFSGVWTYPFSLELVGFPPLKKMKIPSCSFIISIKK